MTNKVEVHYRSLYIVVEVGPRNIYNHIHPQHSLKVDQSDSNNLGDLIKRYFITTLGLIRDIEMRENVREATTAVSHTRQVQLQGTEHVSKSQKQRCRNSACDNSLKRLFIPTLRGLFGMFQPCELSFEGYIAAIERSGRD